MKLDSIIGEILKLLIPFFKAQTVFYLSLILMVTFWIALKYPQVLDFFGLDAWRVNNGTVLGFGTLISTFFFTLVFALKVDSWVAQKRMGKRQNKQERSKYKDLGSEELLFLFQFILNRSTVVEFDSTDPIVSLLCKEGFIYQSTSVVFPHTSTPRFRWSYDHSKAYEIHPETYKYLSENGDELLRSINLESK